MPVTVMPEARRREYLAALGLPLFVARAPLPGAAVSTLPELLPEPPVSAPVRPAPAVPTPAPAQPRPELVASAPVTPPRAPLPALAEAAALLQARPATMARAAAEAAPAAAPLPAAMPAASADQPSFSCRLLRVSPRLAVLLDLGAYPDLGSPERQLWQSLCRAFGWQPQQLAGDFSWPLATSARGGMIGSGSDAARGFLQGWLGRDLTAEDRLLVLGPTLAGFVERPHRLLPSLAELLASPLAKRTLWQQLAGDQTA